MPDDVEQPVTGQDPAQQVSAGNAPWSTDLANTFEDEAVRAQVDQFIRGQVQPYTTKLEQDVAQYRAQVDSDEYQQAKQYFEANQNDPHGVLAAQLLQLYPEHAQEVFDFLNGPDMSTYQEPENEQVSLTPEQEQAFAWIEQQQNLALYEQEKAEFLAANPDINGDFIDVHANTTLNDDLTYNWDAAKASYEAHVEAYTKALKSGDADKIDLGIEQPKDEPAKPEPAKAKEPTEEEYVYKKGDDPWEAIKKGIKTISSAAPTTV